MRFFRAFSLSVVLLIGFGAVHGGETAKDWQKLKGNWEAVEIVADGKVAPADEVKDLTKLAGHLQENWFITKFRKTFARSEMNNDLLIVPARYKGTEDRSEYEEMLPSSPP